MKGQELIDNTMQALNSTSQDIRKLLELLYKIGVADGHIAATKEMLERNS